MPTRYRPLPNSIIVNLTLKYIYHPASSLPKKSYPSRHWTYISTRQSLRGSSKEQATRGKVSFPEFPTDPSPPRARLAILLLAPRQASIRVSPIPDASVDLIPSVKEVCRRCLLLEDHEGGGRRCCAFKSRAGPRALPLMEYNHFLNDLILDLVTRTCTYAHVYLG